MELKMLEISKLKTGNDIRTWDDETSFAELKESIKAKGILFPLVATARGDSFVVLDGHRRLKAFRSLNNGANKKLPVLVMKAKEGDDLEAALIFNAVRENLDAISQAEIVNLLVNKYGRGVKDVAAALGKSERYIWRQLSIFKLPAPMLKSIRENDLTLAHAHWLTRALDNQDVLEESFQRAVKENLSSRDLETLVSGMLSEEKTGNEHYFSPKIITTKAGSRFRFEPRRNSVRVELNLNPDEPIDEILTELKRHFNEIVPKRSKAVG